MGWKNREVEKKFVLKKLQGTGLNKTYQEAASIVRGILKGITRELADGSRDYYWESKGLNADFVRIRMNPQDDEKNTYSGQLTLKHADRKGSNFNRVEIDVELGDVGQGRKFLEYLMGEPLGYIHKDYTVFFLEDDHTTVSVYRVRGDSRVFLEIEAKTQAEVDSIAKDIGSTIEIEYEPKSLYQLFMETKKK